MDIILDERPSPLWTTLKQCGVNSVVAALPRGSDRLGPWPGGAMDEPWDFKPLLLLRESLAAAELALVGIEDSLPTRQIRLGAPGRDDEIEIWRTTIENLGLLGIPLLVYNFSAEIFVQRTNFSTRTRGSALTSSYEHAMMAHAPLTDAGNLTQTELWRNLEYFLRAVVPMAEAAGVTLALHPDDPPVSSIRGIDRIIVSVEAMRRAVELVPSDSNGLVLCQGNVALMTDDVPAAIRELGALGKIKYVHFRDVRGDARSFVETFPDDGQTDMLECMRAYAKIGFYGPARSDHVPELALDENPRSLPKGYSELGRVFALGYMIGTREAAFGAGPPAN